MAVPNHYAVLGIRRSADNATIKAAYKKLAMRWHPDRNPEKPNATVKMQQINAASYTLMDPTRRRAYDRRSPKSPKRTTNTNAVLAAMMEAFFRGLRQRRNSPKAREARAAKREASANRKAARCDRKAARKTFREENKAARAAARAARAARRQAAKVASRSRGGAPPID